MFDTDCFEKMAGNNKIALRVHKCPMPKSQTGLCRGIMLFRQNMPVTGSPLTNLREGWKRLRQGKNNRERSVRNRNIDEKVKNG